MHESPNEPATSPRRQVSSRLKHIGGEDPRSVPENDPDVVKAVRRTRAVIFAITLAIAGVSAFLSTR